MEFRFEEKETYTLDEVKKLFNQNVEKIKKHFIPKEEHQKLVDELTPLKQEKWQTHLKSLTKNIGVKSDMVDDFIKLSPINDAMDENEIVKVFKETLDQKQYFKETIDNKDLLISGKTPDKEQQPTNSYKFVTK